MMKKISKEHRFNMVIIWVFVLILFAAAYGTDGLVCPEQELLCLLLQPLSNCGFI